MVSTYLPAGPSPDSTPNLAIRETGYGDQFTMPLSGRDFGFAMEGSEFVAVSPTPGTGIIGHAAPTTFDETKAYLLVYNGSSKTLYPKFLRLHDTVVSVGDTRMQFTFTRDIGNLFSSGGTAAVTGATNSESSPSATGVVITQGAVVCAAATASRVLLGNYCLRGTIDVVEDTYTFVFGGTDAMVSASRVATVMDISQNVSAMAIGPQKCLKVHQWATSQSTGPTFEMAFGYVLR